MFRVIPCKDGGNMERRRGEDIHGGALVLGVASSSCVVVRVRRIASLAADAPASGPENADD